MTNPVSQPVSRRFFLGGGLSLLAGAALAEAPLRSLRPMARPGAAAVTSTGPVAPGLRPVARATIAQMIAEANLGGSVGYSVWDAETGRVLEEGTAEEALPPASVTKAVTALYALEALGAAYRFETRLIATGPIEAGVIQGDLILAGGGDPVLDTDALARMAADLRAAGVTGVRGDFRVWGGALPYVDEIEPGQLDHLGYNPALSGLNLNFNRVYFEWRRSGSSYTVTMDARSETLRPQVSIAQMRVVDRTTPVYDYAQVSGIDSWTVARRALGDAGGRWLPVRAPAAYAGDVFRTLAAGEGIRFGPAKMQEAAPEGTTLVTYQSAPLDELIHDMLLYSTNLTAEVLGLTATTAREGAVPESLATSAASMVRWLAEAHGTTGRFVDHSGLSDESEISAHEMARLLVDAGADSALRALMKPIPLLDPEGNPLAATRAEVAAKTGTLNFVSTLAGYLRAEDGGDLVFAIFCANEAERALFVDSEDEMPEGARGYNGRAKRLQQRMLQRWSFARTGPEVLPEIETAVGPASAEAGPVAETVSTE